MSTELQTNITNFANAVGTDVNLLKALLTGGASDLSALTTSDTTTVVAAINSLQAAITTLTAGAYSDAQADARVQAALGSIASPAANEWAATQEVVDHVATEIATAITAITDGADGALDTLNEIAEALQNNPDVITNIIAAQANRLRFDAAQTLTPAQRLTAGQNLGIGDVTTDYVAVYAAARDA